MVVAEEIQNLYYNKHPHPSIGHSIKGDARDLMRKGIIKPGSRWIWHPQVGGVVVERDLVKEGPPAGELQEETRKYMGDVVKKIATRYKVNLARYGPARAAYLFERDKARMITW